MGKPEYPALHSFLPHYRSALAVFPTVTVLLNLRLAAPIQRSITMPGFVSLQVKKSQLIRKGLQGSVFVAPYSASAITAGGLFDASSGELTALPAGYYDLGWTTDAGAKVARAIKTSDISAWGSNDPVRTDITSDVTTLVVEAQETKLETVGLHIGVDPTTVTPGSNGVVEIPQPNVSAAIHYRILVVSVDETDAGEIAICKFLPRASVTDIGDQSFANGDAATTWPLTFTAYPDPVLGYAVDTFFGGAGWKALQGAEDVPRTVTCTTTTTNTGSPPLNTILIATAGNFYTGDVGSSVTGAGIPANTKILSVPDSTHAVMSAAATAIATGVAVLVA